MPQITTVDNFSQQPVAQQSTRQVTAKTNTTSAIENAVRNAQLQSMPPTEGVAVTEPVGTPDTNEAADKSNEPLSAQYATLARKERAIRSQIKQLEADRLAHEQNLNAVKEAESFRERLVKDPLAVLGELGITYDNLVDQAITQPNPELKALKDEIQSLRSIIDEGKEESKTQQNTQWENAVQAIRNDVVDLVSENPEFETIKETGSVDDVVELITRTYQQEKRSLTIEEAAKMVEDELLEDALKIARIKKVQSRLTPQEAATVSPTSNQKPPATTLTGSMQTSRPLTSVERAILAFNNQLKP